MKHYGIPKKCLLICILYTTVNNAFLNMLNWKYICQPACGRNCMYVRHYSANIIELFDASLEAEWGVLILKYRLHDIM